MRQCSCTQGTCILCKLRDLQIQATKERSHYYVKSVVEEAIQALTLPQVTSEEILDSWKSEWEAVPSQDNEGFVPDRGGFQVGFYCGAQWMQKKLKGEK